MADIDSRSPKRTKMTPDPSQPGIFEANADFIALDDGSNGAEHAAFRDAPIAPRSYEHVHQSRSKVDPRSRSDRPRTKHPLPGHEPWILIRTKLGRRFVHNTETKESLWRIPESVQAGVAAFDDQQEKQGNAAWAEKQLLQMRPQAISKPDDKTQNGTQSNQRRRRRSESLQREDEEAMLAELAAEAEIVVPKGQDDSAAKTIEPRGYLGEASDSEYEYVEITDSEGEHDELDEDQPHPEHNQEQLAEVDEDAPVEFGEDDIAYQLAMMGEEYGLEPEEYGIPEEGQDGEEGALTLSADEAVALFYEMLDEHGVSPFTPWDRLIADTTSTSVVLDDRYTLLPSSKARKDAWDQWSRDRAAQVQAERAQQDKRDPRIGFLDFLSRHASTKLYWPEFKRKFKREPELNDRALQDKDREKLYREIVAKLKMPEAKRRDELKALLKAQQKGNGTSVPEKVLASAVFHSISEAAREEIVGSFGYRVSAAL